MSEAFFAVLFDPDQHVCYGGDKTHTRVMPAFPPREGSIFFSINALDGEKDRKPTEPWHRANKPRRASHNVTCYRNILIEMDKIPLEEQTALITMLGLPYSTCTYSGGKSNHFIISLESPLQTELEYKVLVLRIYEGIKNGTGKDCIDTQVKDPARFSRYPGTLRAETNKIQTLLEVRSRVTNEQLQDWLTLMKVPEVIVKPPTAAALPRLPGLKGVLSGKTKEFLFFGAGEGEWNSRLFAAGCDAFRCGYDKEEFTAKAERITGHLDAKDLSTINSAFNGTYGAIKQ